MNSFARADSRGDTLSISGRFLSKFLNWLITGIWFLCRVLLITWATLAIYYSNLPSAGLRVALAVSFTVLAIWLLWLSRDRRASGRRRGRIALAFRQILFNRRADDSQLRRARIGFRGPE